MSTLALAAVVLVASPSALTRAGAAFAELDYEQCLVELSAVRAADARTALLKGTCAFHLGREREAADALTSALKLDPRTELPPASHPRLKALFETVVRSRVPAPVEPRPVALTPHETVSPVVIVQGPSNRRHVLSWVLGALTLGSAGAGVGFTLDALDAKRRYGDSGGNLTAAAMLRAQAERSILVAQVSYAAAGAAAVAALLTWLLEAP